MKVTCPTCRRSFDVDAKRVTAFLNAQGVYINKCPHCNDVYQLRSSAN